MYETAVIHRSHRIALLLAMSIICEFLLRTVRIFCLWGMAKQAISSYSYQLTESF